MLFSPTANLGALILWCRAFKHGLSAGLDMPRIFEMQASKGPRDLRVVADNVAKELRSGESLDDALRPYASVFPSMFLDMIKVGEETGNLPEVFSELEEYYTLLRQMQSEFRRALVLPVVVLSIGIGIIGGLIFILGFIAQTRGGTPADVTGLGLTGTSGAITWLVGAATVAGLIYVGYRFFIANRDIRAKLEGAVILLPMIGQCYRTFAMHRFCTALSLTMNSSMPIRQAIGLSLSATGNSYFQSCLLGVQAQLKGGADLTDALRNSGRFDDIFINTLAVGEASGSLPEAMKKLGKQYAEESAHQLKILTKLAGVAVTLIYIIFMVIMILMVARTYIGAITGLL